MFPLDHRWVRSLYPEKLQVTKKSNNQDVQKEAYL